MNNLIVRSLTGAVFATVVIGSILFSHYAAAFVFAGFMLLGIIEFYKLFENHHTIDINWKLGTAFIVLIYGLLVGWNLGYINEIFLLLILPLFFILILTELWRKKKNPLLNSAILIFGGIYVAIPFFLITFINTSEIVILGNQYLPFETIKKIDFLPSVAGMFILIWTNDSFAYFTGRLIGKTKLFERISPNKTWEGTIGGIVFTVLMGFLIGNFIPVNNSLGFWIGAALLIAPCAILGDLFQSMMKRSLNIKDSGNILPGHGGILDRFDAMLFAVPFFMAWTFIYTYFSANF